MVKITFLGQAGLLFEINDKKILIDPYLSDNVKKYEPENYRRQKIDESFLKIIPDIIVITHAHLDHYDKQTLKFYLTDDGNVTVLSPTSVWEDVKKTGGRNNYVLFDAGASVCEYGVKFIAVKAVHSDPYAIGVIIEAENENYYITGDTLFRESVFNSLPNISIKAVFLPINGVKNNMNVSEAVEFSKRIGAEYTVPVHFGMFDCMTGKELKTDNAVVPQIYKEIVLK